MCRVAVCVVWVLAVFGLALPASAQPAHEGLRLCRHGHRHQVAADAHAQLFKSLIKPTYLEYVGVFGCLYGRHWTYELGEVASYSAHGGGGVERATLHGELAVYEDVVIDSGYGSSTDRHVIVVRDLRNGRVLHRVSTASPSIEGPAAIAIVVKASNGATAWTEAPRYEKLGATWVPSFYDVHVVDGLGSRVVAHDREIDPKSLRIRGEKLYWTRAGDPASTPLN
jgi:hypothetical protein